MSTLPLGCPPLDELLSGGIERGIITKLFGEAGTGKTNILLQACRECVRLGGKAAYIDTESVSVERLRQICTPEEYKKTLDNILFFCPTSFKEQEKTITETLTLKTIKLLVVDTITMLYRGELDSNTDGAHRSFVRQMTTLQMAARKRGLYVIVAEQVYTDQQDEIKPFTCKETEHMSKTVIKLERKRAGVRQATLMKHRFQPEGKTALFRITQNGLA
ncbi:MAG: DNA repair and recombination protein RadB [Methanobacteriota archaeon]